MSEQPKHPYERFLEDLPDDWDRLEMRQIGRIVSGGTPSRDVPSFWGGNIPWVTPGEISGESAKFLHDSAEHITQAGLAGSGANLLPANSLMVTTRATLGARAINVVPMATNQGFKSIDFSDKREAEYQYYLIEKVRPELLRRASGTTFLEISRGEFSTIVVPDPPLPEKQKIAKVLDTLDTAIRETEAIIGKLKAIKQGLLHDLLTRGIDANGELRPPPFEAPHLYRETEMGLLPKGWTTSELKNLLAAVDPAMRSGPFGSALLKEELVEQGIPFLGIDNVHVERFVADYTRFVSPAKFAALSRYAVRPSDLMITIMGTVGRCCLVPDDIGLALSSKHTWTISLDRSLYSPYLAMLQINYSPWVLGHFSKDQQGGTMAAIRSETLRSMRVPVPPREEQTLMEQRLRKISERIEVEAQTLAKLKLQKSGLMDDLLTGRVRVTPLLEQAGRAMADTGV